MATNDSLPCTVAMLFSFRFIYLTIPLAVIIVIKTVFVVYTAYRTTTMTKHIKVLVTSLSITDLILGAAYVCVGDSENLIVKLGISQPKYFESFLLGAWYSSVVVCIAHFGIIAIESYIHIAHPFVYMRVATKRNAYIVILCLWTFGLSYMFIPVLVYTEDHYHEKCILLHPPLEYYCIGGFSVIVSFATVLVSNFKIACLAFRNKTAIIARRHRILGDIGQVTFKARFQAAVTSVKFFSIMIGVYIVCTCPSAVCVGVNIFHPVPAFIYLPSIYLVPVNSILYVLIWFFTNRKFAHSVMQTFSDAKTCFCKG